MSTSEFDSYFPTEFSGPRRKRLRDAGAQERGRGREQGGANAVHGPGGVRSAREAARTFAGRGEQPVVPQAEFSSYYGQGVVKPVPWKHEIPAYLFLGGVAGGAGLLAAGAHLVGNGPLRCSARLTAMVGAGLSGIALIADLGRPERFLNMLRTVKLTSPMSVGTWIFSGFSAFSGLTTACELDRLLGGREDGPGLPVLGGLLRPLDGVGSAGQAFFAAPLAAYTAVLLTDTATPLWFESRRHLPFVFVSSAALASGGIQMAVVPVTHAGPARRLALLGVVGDLVAVHRLEEHLGSEGVLEALHTGHPGTMMRAAKALVVAGGVGTLVAGALRSGLVPRRAAVLAATPGVARAVSVGAGLALAAASALTRFAVVEGGQESARDPRYTVEPQRRRLEARRAAGRTGDSITT
ncbi:NrfD/PsrC family molybdoenzyme membrane anchor subunit [Kytococcus sp. Marseille-QA3725]